MGFWQFATGGGSGGGTGDVVGPASSTDNAVARWDLATGKLLQDSALTVSDVAGGVVTLATTAGNALAILNTAPAAAAGASVAGDPLTVTAGAAVASTDTDGAAAGGSVTITGGAAARRTSGNANGGDVLLVGGAGIGTGTQGVVKANGTQVVVGSTGATDNAILRADGTGGATAQTSPLLVADDGLLSIGSNADYALKVYGGTPTAWGVNFGIYALGPSTEVRMQSAGMLAWTAGTATDIRDSQVVRVAPGVLRTEAPSSFGVMLSGVLVEANTAGSGTPNAIAANESGTVFTNEGVTAKNYEALPTAAAGYQYTFIVQDADGMRIVANTDDTIRVIDKVTAAAGYIESTTIGSTVTLVSVNAVEWYAISINGVWTDGTFTYDDTSLTTP